MDMNSNPSFTSIRATEHVSVADSRSPAWGAVIAGLIAAIGVHFLMLMLGMAAGLGAAEPATDDNPAAAIGAGAAAVWSISALIAMWVGGWVAGRCAVRVHSVSGGVHGFLVWCLATIITLFLITSSAGRIIGGSAQLVGQGLTAAGQVAGGAADLAKQATEQNGSLIQSFVDEATPATGGNLSPAQAVAARREIGQAARQLFREGGDLRDPAARTAVVEALQRSANVPEQDANRMVDGWISSMERGRQQLEQMKEAAAVKAREVADKSADALAKAALFTFIGFLIGAIVAVLGGRTGARWEYSHTELAGDPTLDPSNRRSHRRVRATTVEGTA